MALASDVTGLSLRLDISDEALQVHETSSRDKFTRNSLVFKATLALLARVARVATLALLATLLCLLRLLCLLCLLGLRSRSNHA